MSITDFLNARIAEDEAVAREALIGIHGKHETSRDYAGYVLSSERETTEAQDEFIETFWPARVLAECAAKRAIVELHAPVDYSGLGMKSPNACTLCGADRGMHDWEWMKDSFPCPTIRALAAVYADHPEHQDEWRVGA